MKISGNGISLRAVRCFAMGQHKSQFRGWRKSPEKILTEIFVATSSVFSPIS
jgi:hypothetical protein